MPMLIKTPEEILRKERRDVYFLEFKHKDNEATARLNLKKMQAWFTQNMPNSPTQRMGPSEYSGWISGGPILLEIDFTPSDFEKFCTQWEDENGTSTDPRFQCYVYLYKDWWERYGQFKASLDRPDKPLESIWIETPLGILSYCREPDTESNQPRPEDLWANAQIQWPELEQLKFDELNYGSVYCVKANNHWCLLWNAPFEKWPRPTDEHWKKVADWLRLPADADIGSEY